MPLLLLCLGSILACSCPASCQPSSSLPPLSGSITVAWSHLCTRSTMAPSPFCAVAPAPSPSESGHETRSSPSASSRPARQWTLSLAARIAAADRQAHAQAALLQPSGPRSQTRWFLCLPLRRRHKTVPEPFSYLARSFLHTRDRHCLHSLHRRGTRPINWHRQRGWTSDLLPAKARAQGKPCGELPTSLVTVKPVRRTLATLYLYISCYVTANKPVLSYLLLRLLPHQQLLELNLPEVHLLVTLYPSILLAAFSTFVRKSLKFI
jgi:hypothetical protein